MTYVLGSDDPEIQRLDGQAGWLEQPTRVLLRLTGIGPGMRVLDLGTGLGHVSRLLASLVGPDGEVVAVDADARMLEHAEERRTPEAANVRYVHADARTYRDPAPFDAVTERLMLFHLADAVDVVRHHAAGLRPGGTFVAIDFDIGAARSEPPTEPAMTCVRWIVAAFRAAGADPVIGTRLTALLAQAGLADVAGFGVQGYLGPDDPAAPAMIAGVVRSLTPQIIAAGIATEEEVGLDTLEARLGDSLRAARAIVLPPTVSGAFGRRAA